MRINRCVRFGFGGGTVLVACRGDQVSFYTTVGAWCPLKGQTPAMAKNLQFA